MRKQLQLAGWMIVGSYFIHCGQNAMHGGPGTDGAVVDAHADAGSGGCCAVTGPVYTKVFDDMVASDTYSPAIEVGPYRQAIVYIGDATGNPLNCSYYVFFRSDSGSPWGGIGEYSLMGRYETEGAEMMIFPTCNGARIAVTGVQ